MKTQTKLLIALIFTAFCFGSNTEVKAQNYDQALGLRGGYSGGITYKNTLGGHRAFEGILSTRYRGVKFTGLYQIHKPAFRTKNFHWYYGAGAHVGFYDNRYYFGPDGEVYRGPVTSVGIDGILGLEYQIPEIPFLVSIDVKPFWDIIYPGPSYWDAGLSLRYYW